MLLWDAMKHGDPLLCKNNWIKGLISTLQSYGYNDRKEVAGLLRNVYDDAGETFQRKVKGGRSGFFQRVCLRDWLQVKRSVINDKKLGYSVVVFEKTARSCRHLIP